ncbi:pectate lyase family protein [Streptomyces litchfieldiae]|uniref:pectate lyase n=1 Tax=Streptomyces litchfieldiae TaxID=3075543 RepID=A0ABU2MU34_9ACTN|nr:right-handed parallel beta-helix repeat-containing protein [Streptomyces sp. DSM 44938]MDT0344907.1 right-handed parallel beta-helix repeat-containing protein [Streptomyces sp. DSM 44938]
MRRTSARFKLVSAVAVVAAAATMGGITAANGTAAEPTADVGTLAVGTPTGFGAGTTGGAGGRTVTVSNASDFIAAAGSSERLQIQVNTTINLSSMARVTSNKTIIGVGTSGRINGSGLNVSNASNVIIQNLSFTNSNDDGINVQYSTNVWIDHNEFSNPNDGALDIKRASTGVTVSWNHTYDSDKNMLLGHSDSNASEDVGKLRVTYHHNWFDGVNQRNPRVRFGDPVHVYNNYYNDIGSYGVASTENAGVLVEANYFEDTEDPFHLGEGSSDDGRLVARNNHFVNSGSGQTGGSVASIPYGYSADPAANVKSIVMNGAGTGKI